MEQRQVSVIVPVYNGEAYLEDCIGSIVSQSYPAGEIIIVNDGSTDRTGDICRKLEKLHEMICIITLDDVGVSAGRNRAIDQAKGDYLMFVDADDRIHPEMILSLVRDLEDTDSDIAGCGFLTFSREEEWERAVTLLHREEGYLKVFDHMEFVEHGILGGDSRCWGKLYRREAIGDVRFREGMTIGEDMLFVLELALKGVRIAVGGERLYGYYQNPRGAMNRTFQDSYMDQIRCWEAAGELIRPRLPELMGKVNSVILMSAMLTASKIALLPGKERKGQKGNLKLCRRKLMEAVRVRGAFQGLSPGYRLKVICFRYLPGLYVSCYHIWKKR